MSGVGKAPDARAEAWSARAAGHSKPLPSVAEAVTIAREEEARLRSGAGGYGGNSPEAIRLAQVLHVLAEAEDRDDHEPAESVEGLVERLLGDRVAPVRLAATQALNTRDRQWADVRVPGRCASRRKRGKW